MLLFSALESALRAVVLNCRLSPSLKELLLVMILLSVQDLVLLFRCVPCLGHVGSLFM